MHDRYIGTTVEVQSSEPNETIRGYRGTIKSFEGQLCRVTFRIKIKNQVSEALVHPKHLRKVNDG